MQNNHSISVVIPCKNDPLIVRCVRSIDYDCNIVIVFNGSPSNYIKMVKEQLKDKNIIYYLANKANLALALETGTQKAPTDIVLYMDSDCIFEKGAIAKFTEKIACGNPENEVYKGDVVFGRGKNWIENIIAKSRTHHTVEVLTAYKPPLAISKNILKKIGGYAFDQRLIWREDSDLDNRIRKAGIKILPVKNGIIHHKNIDLKTDLRSTFRYGIGLAIANVLNITLTEVPRSVMSTYHSQGLWPAIYMVFRNRIYDLGYWYARIRIKLNIHKFDNQLDYEVSQA